MTKKESATDPLEKAKEELASSAVYSAMTLVGTLIWGFSMVAGLATQASWFTVAFFAILLVFGVIVLIRITEKLVNQYGTYMSLLIQHNSQH